MKSNKKIGRILGFLFLLVFIIGVTMYQFLQSPLFMDNFLSATSSSANQIIISSLLGVLSGVLSVIISVLLLPIFKRYNANLAYSYFAFSILYFVAIVIDNVSVLSLLELSKEYVKNGGENSDSFKIIGTVLYGRHWWTHYFTLLISCFPVFVLYYTLYLSKLVPRIISVIGILAVIMMFTEELFSMFGFGISMNMLLPMGLIQLFLPFWLLYKGLNSSMLETEIKEQN
ncbi:DUF4386 domain-containing protein [Flavobacteriaceae bacterium KMM 6897]|nr:DUF4386 domain-containing protein [Flavobacteriaceae bacterium KMM 6897]